MHYTNTIRFCFFCSKPPFNLFHHLIYPPFKLQSHFCLIKNINVTPLLQSLFSHDCDWSSLILAVKLNDCHVTISGALECFVFIELVVESKGSKQMNCYLNVRCIPIRDNVSRVKYFQEKVSFNQLRKKNP